ncbi:hypothetical protein PVAP13_5NG314846 [Panicum virgatum]|uniref:Uncharacterized protein n=1 Tax=Panicum virgatum TaxID=38727 RepID=A0A8T0RZ38_PANVG|nr:hypothetical protein PVAP13_5NG314846 [Panicum virgatum]
MRSLPPLSWIHPPPLYHGLCCASLASLHLLLYLILERKNCRHASTSGDDLMDLVLGVGDSRILSTCST